MYGGLNVDYTTAVVGGERVETDFSSGLICTDLSFIK